MTHLLGLCLVSWATKRQHSLAMPTAEAEYVAAASCCGQSLWIRQQLKDFCIDTECIPIFCESIDTECIPIFCDKISTINIAKNPCQHKTTKHINICHHSLRDNIKKGLISTNFYATDRQIAHIFTAALSREQFERNRLELGMTKRT